MREPRVKGADGRRSRAREDPVPARRREQIGLTALVTLVGAIVAALISGTNLTFELWPSLKPDPKASVGAELAVLELDENVTWSASRRRLSRSGLATPGPRTPGNVFYLRARIEGFKRESLKLKWFTYNAGGQQRPGPRSSASEEAIFEPKAPINTQIARVWVKTPEETGRYYVRFELYSDDVLLAFIDSKPFSVVAY